MASMYEVADWFLVHSPDVNNKKLQKLTYYAYSWFIALYNDSSTEIKEKFFPAHFEAWVHGAVEPKLYATYRKYGSAIIPAPSEEPKKQVNEVYGKFSGNELEYICHQESAWLNARGDLPPNAPSNNLISDEDIFNCFAARL